MPTKTSTQVLVMTSWHGNAFGITGPLWGDSTDYRREWIRGHWGRSLLLPRTSFWTNNVVAGDLQRHRFHVSSLYTTFYPVKYAHVFVVFVLLCLYQKVIAFRIIHIHLLIMFMVTSLVPRPSWPFDPDTCQDRFSVKAGCCYLSLPPMGVALYSI